mgnify:CR=1 FL=1
MLDKKYIEAQKGDVAITYADTSKLESIINFNSKLADSKNIEVAKRGLYLDADSNCKSLHKLKEKKKEEHLKREEKKEETELEDIIGARFVFDQTIY